MHSRSSRVNSSFHAGEDTTSGNSTDTNNTESQHTRSNLPTAPFGGIIPYLLEYQQWIMAASTLPPPLFKTFSHFHFQTYDRLIIFGQPPICIDTQFFQLFLATLPFTTVGT